MAGVYPDRGAGLSDSAMAFSYTERRRHPQREARGPSIRYNLLLRKETRS
jgi:hypothetical protein